VNDSTWCATRLSALESDLNQLQFVDSRFGEQLRELRAGLGGAVAVELFNRYLGPYQEETTRSREQQRAHLESLRAVVARMEDAEAPLNEIQHLSDSSARRLSDAASEVATAHHRADRSFEESTGARESSNEALWILQSI
jgi:hypothetical protein